MFANTSEALAKKTFIELKEQAQRYIKAINEEDFKKAALQVYYPESLQGEEKEDEIKVISKFITIFSNEFGTISNIKTVAEIEKYYSTFVMAGSLKFWTDKVNSLHLQYQVIYSKQKQGFMIFNFSEVNGGWELRSVEYGLPASRADAKNTITKVFGKLVDQ
tara:strand:+ start:368 stop:853 length:486 start_codon:yes stop_codon:yes gene_type:complete